MKRSETRRWPSTACLKSQAKHGSLILVHSTHVIELDRLTKRYGDVVGIEGLSFAVDEGEIFGLLGPNGTGKTTTVRLLLDFIRPSAGTASVFGLNPRADGTAIRSRVGYLPGDFVTYGYMTAEDVAHYFASLRGTPRKRFGEVCERFQLDPTRKISELSKGNRQKVGLVQAFMNDPDLLILDEPTSGLDPLLQKEFQDLILSERSEGKTVLLSSHVLSEVEATADRVCVIRDGTAVAIDSVVGLTALHSWEVVIQFAELHDVADYEQISGVEVVNFEGNRLTLQVEGEHAIDAVIKASAGYEVSRFESQRSSLEDVVLNLYSDEQVTELGN